jgi:hypothetical protein
MSPPILHQVIGLPSGKRGEARHSAGVPRQGEGFSGVTLAFHLNEFQLDPIRPLEEADPPSTAD